MTPVNTVILQFLVNLVTGLLLLFWLGTVNYLPSPPPAYDWEANEEVAIPIRSKHPDWDGHFLM